MAPSAKGRGSIPSLFSGSVRRYAHNACTSGCSRSLGTRPHAKEAHTRSPSPSLAKYAFLGLRRPVHAPCFPPRHTGSPSYVVRPSAHKAISLVSPRPQSPVALQDSSTGHITAPRPNKPCTARGFLKHAQPRAYPRHGGPLEHDCTCPPISPPLTRPLGKDLP